MRKIGTTVYCYDANGNMVKRAGSSIMYASYNLPTVINAGSNSSTLSYGAFRNRHKQVAVAGGVSEETLYVAGLFERVTPSNGPVQYRHYIPGGNGVAAIHSRSSGVGTTTYVHSDHLGSPQLFTRSDGTELLRVSFGAYGERRDGADWSGPPSSGDLTTIAGLTRRGFTGHEHLDAVGLIHMNGRVYDPAAGRFLGTDPIVEVGNSQSSNSYSYVWNNPLTMIDPSGFQGEDVAESEPATPRFPDWPYGCPFGFGWRCDIDPWYENEIFESQVERALRTRLYQAYLGNQWPDRVPLLATFKAEIGDWWEEARPKIAAWWNTEVKVHQCGRVCWAVGGPSTSVTMTRGEDLTNAAMAIATAASAGTLAWTTVAPRSALLRPYGGPGGGHHVPAKGLFRGATGYDANAALAVPRAELARLGVSHSAVTGAQMTGYGALTKSGLPLTRDAVAAIETNALVRGGMSANVARATVSKAIKALQNMETQPTRIPWGR